MNPLQDLLADPERLFYGEHNDAEDFLCPVHGSRLSSLGLDVFCPECREDLRREEHELVREAMPLDQDQDIDDGSRCVFIRGRGFYAFSCTMPWWA